MAHRVFVLLALVLPSLVVLGGLAGITWLALRHRARRLAGLTVVSLFVGLLVGVLLAELFVNVALHGFMEALWRVVILPLPIFAPLLNPSSDPIALVLFVPLLVALELTAVVLALAGLNRTIRLLMQEARRRKQQSPWA